MTDGEKNTIFYFSCCVHIKVVINSSTFVTQKIRKREREREREGEGGKEKERKITENQKKRKVFYIFVYKTKQINCRMQILF